MLHCDQTVRGKAQLTGRLTGTRRERPDHEHAARFCLSALPLIYTERAISGLPTVTGAGLVVAAGGQGASLLAPQATSERDGGDGLARAS